MKTDRITLFITASLCAALAACGGDDDGTSSGTTATSTGTGASQVLQGSISADRTLGADTEWELSGLVFVEPGVTLTIEPGTVIKGDKATTGTLVVKPGGKLMAQGTADAPIVFTSLAEPGSRRAGDWGGVVVLGKAPINVPGGVAEVEGIAVADGSTRYGGTVADDDSGVLEYVRIEYSGVQISPDNEINGLTFGGVGSGTRVDHVMVHHTTDDCFEFFGGTVDAQHLICAYNGDDGIDWDFGYTGRLQFVAIVQDPTIADDANGFEADNDGDGSLNAPRSNPTIYNVSMCGQGSDNDKQQYGMLPRRSTRGTFANMLITGFEACVDIRDATTEVSMTNSICANSTGTGVVENIAYPETGVDEDDDGGLDEVAWFQGGMGNSVGTGAVLEGCFGTETPSFLPAATITTDAATPPSDGFFDVSAAYIGAFKADDTWASGAWVSYDAD